jgi:hypothetical protein
MQYHHRLVKKEETMSFLRRFCGPAEQKPLHESSLVKLRLSSTTPTDSGSEANDAKSKTMTLREALDRLDHCRIRTCMFCLGQN